jgi:glycosyltransferase involved in cell wall biosynthesis
VTTNPNQPESSADRIETLERELARDRALLRSTQQRLAVKEREIQDIHRSRAWALVAAFRSLKLRLLDPLLGLVGISWPRRSAIETGVSAKVEPRTDAHDVVCFSICEWDARFQRPQQLMSLFAAAGHRVFYVSPHFRRDGPSCRITLKRRKVYEVTLRGKELNVYAHRLGGDARDLLMEGLDSLVHEASLGPAAAIVQLPFWWPLARLARERFGWPVIYDCMDFHAGFSTVRKAMADQEDELLAQADVVVASSVSLEQHALGKRDDVVLLRNAGDYEHFAKTPRANNARPVIGYYGAIADWFDSALVADLAEHRPDWDFLLIGSTYGADISRLARLPNVSLPGEEPYESLPEWLGRFDVAIIPFKRTKLTEATNPVKVYEMLAGGKPIVSVPIPEVAALAPLVRLASNAEEFEREIVAVLADPDEGIEERRAFAKEHTWERRFEVLQGLTAAALVRRESRPSPGR